MKKIFHFKFMSGLIIGLLIGTNVFLFSAIVEEMPKRTKKQFNKEVDKAIALIKNESYYPTVFEIEESIRDILATNKYAYRLTPEQIRRIAIMLEIGEREFSIEYISVLCIMTIESNFNPRAINKNKPDKRGKITYDYGLGQVNSDEWIALTQRSIPILNKYGIRYADNHYNIEMNLMNALNHLYDYRKVLLNRNEYSLKRWIQSYNCGINGSQYNTIYWIERREKYYAKYDKFRTQYDKVIVY